MTEEDLREVSQEESEGVIGSKTLQLYPGDRWIFDRYAVYFTENIHRQAIARMPCTRGQDSQKTKYQIFKDRLRSVLVRAITGECLLLDEHYVEEGRQEGLLKITSREVGGKLEELVVDEPWLIRKTTFFGAQENIDIQAYSPLSELCMKRSFKDNWKSLLKTMYGPSWIMQRLMPHGKDKNRVYLQIDGDLEKIELKEGEEIKVNPMSLWAWKEGTKVDLTPFGSWSERLISGCPPYVTKVTGPGIAIISNQMYSDGYLGELFTPWRAGHFLARGVKNLFRRIWIFGDQ